MLLTAPPCHKGQMCKSAQRKNQKEDAMVNTDTNQLKIGYYYYNYLFIFLTIIIIIINDENVFWGELFLYILQLLVMHINVRHHLNIH